MNQKLKNYLKEIDQIIVSENTKQLDEIIKNHLQQIHFYQHERLVHFLVTGLVTILAVLCLLCLTIQVNFGVFILFILLLILFIPYIFYYYSLENGVQKMYDQYWKLKALEKSNHGSRK